MYQPMASRPAVEQEEIRRLRRERQKHYRRKHRRTLKQKRATALHRMFQRVYMQNFRARVKGADGPGITAGEVQALLIRCNCQCMYCGRPLEPVPKSWALDHFVPLSKGGRHEIDNIVPACCACNNLKNDDIWIPVIDVLNGGNGPP
jgi:5-methylcytosine-specific restriction endonuclease McrA